MTLPEIARELIEIGRALGNRRLIQLAAMMKRRRNQRPVPSKTTRPLTPNLRRAIRIYVRQHPHTTQLDAAIRFRVNQGRVSEALHGKRT